MRRLDEEMQLNAFLFRDVEGKVTGGLGEGERKAVEEKSGSDDNVEDGRKKAEDGKKKYILQRAQNMVYQYKKKEEHWYIIRNMAFLCLIIMAVYALFAAGSVLYSFAQYEDYNVEMMLPLFITLGVYVCCVPISISVFRVSSVRRKKIDEIVNKIYNMTVAYQMNAGEYNHEDSQKNLQKFVDALQRCVDEDGKGNKKTG